MTPEERARAALRLEGFNPVRVNDGALKILKDVEAQIIAAVEEEREACAQVACAWVWPDKPDTPDSNLASHVASKIARKIRARSERKQKEGE